jgi:hypothetical protein
MPLLAGHDPAERLRIVTSKMRALAIAQILGVHTYRMTLVFKIVLF